MDALSARKGVNMGKIEEVRAEMVAAMKNKDKDRKDTLSALLAALKNKAIDKRADLTEAEENEVIKKEIKQTQETKELAPADRTDIIEECEKRLAVLKEFAPEEMSEEAIRKEISEVLAGLGIEAPTGKDKGRIMKELIRFITVRAFTRQHQASYGDSALIRPFENRIQPVDMIFIPVAHKNSLQPIDSLVLQKGDHLPGTGIFPGCAARII